MKALEIDDGQVKCHGMGIDATSAANDGVLEHAESIRWLSRVKVATVCFRSD